MNDRRRVKVSLTRAQTKTLQRLIETQTIVSEDYHDVERYKAINRACQKALESPTPNVSTATLPRARRQRPTHYCIWCGLDMTADEHRICSHTDGDVCEARAYARLRDLKNGHPRLQAEAIAYSRGECKHRPKCQSWTLHLRRCR